jgi:hypothetical protein
VKLQRANVSDVRRPSSGHEILIGAGQIHLVLFARSDTARVPELPHAPFMDRGSELI